PDAGHRGVFRHDRRDCIRAPVHAGVLRGVPLDRRARPALRPAPPRGRAAGRVGARRGRMAATVRDNVEHHRFELDADGGTALMYYRLEPGVITLVHTEVPPALGGK